MSYLDAPATKALAQHCCACGTPITNADSLVASMGRHCRKKYLPNFRAMPAAVREEAGRIVNQIGLLLTDRKAWAPSVVEEVVGYTVGLRGLSLDKIADIVEERIHVIVVTEKPDDSSILLVKTPYSEEVAAAFRQIPGRRWNRDTKANEIPLAQKGALFALLKAHFPGGIGRGRQGRFTIPGTAPIPAIIGGEAHAPQ